MPGDRTIATLALRITACELLRSSDQHGFLRTFRRAIS